MASRENFILGVESAAFENDTPAVCIGVLVTNLSDTVYLYASIQSNVCKNLFLSFHTKQQTAVVGVRLKTIIVFSSINTIHQQQAVLLDVRETEPLYVASVDRLVALQ